MENKFRVSWIDDAKFFAIFCVILGHSFSLIQGDYKGYNEFNLFIVAFNMPLFAFLSGITSYKSLNKIDDWHGLVKYYNKLTIHIGIPTVTYTLIAMLVGSVMQLRFLKVIVYLLVLLILCSAFYYFQKHSDKSKWMTIAAYLILPICLLKQYVWYFVYVLLSMFAAATAMYVTKSIAKPSLCIPCFSVILLLISAALSPISPFYSTIELFLPFVIGYVIASKCGLHPFVGRNNKLNKEQSIIMCSGGGIC